MTEHSVSSSRHMKDKILHGRHLREILLEQQKVQEQRRGRPVGSMVSWWGQRVALSQGRLKV